MKYDKIRETTFKEIQLNAGIILNSFNPEDGSFELTDIVGTTTGGAQFTATPTFADFGEDIDNCPKNSKELKKLTSWEATLSGTFNSLTADAIKELVGVADISGTKITPRTDLKAEDFSDKWWVGDYSDKNTGTTAGYIAIHLMNALSSDGFSLQSADAGKGQFSFTYTAHYSMDAQDTVPFEIYVKAGT